MKKIFIIIFSLAAASVFSQQGWFYLNPTPDGISRYGLKMFSASSGICRSYNSIFKTHDAGKTWREISFNLSELPLGSLNVLDSTTVFAVLGAGKLVKSVDGCESWKFITQLPYNYNAVTFVLGTLGFNLITDSTRKSKIFRTTNGGFNWSEVYSLDSSFLRGVSFVNETVGYAAGYKYVNSYPERYQSKILKTSDGGISWDTIPSKFADGLYGIKFLNESTGFLFAYINSSSLFLRTTNGGITWRDSVWRGVSDIKFFDENSGIALFDNNQLGKTTNAGKNWTYSPITNPTINNNTVPNSIYFFNQSTGICVGTLGLNLRTTDSGISWGSYNSPAQITDEIDDIIFKDENTGFAMGWSKNIFKTTNGGINWNVKTFGNSNTKLGALAYAGNSTWYLTDYFNPTLFKTTDDGLNWISSNPGFSGITDLQFINENTGFGVCKYTRFVKTTNGGLNWYRYDSLGSQNWTVNFIDENTGYIGGGTWLRKTTNGGISFDTIPHRYVDYAWDVKFLSRDTIIASGTTHDPNIGVYNRGTIWKSTDAGLTWAPKFYTIASYLNGPLRFPNSKTGYVIDGQEYMYKTTNGGDNWFQIKCPEGNFYAMSFLNAETGFMGGYKGEILKTTNGGASAFIDIGSQVPDKFYLHQNYPNPFNPTTKIKFVLPVDGNVKIIIFDILGREVKKLTDEKFTAGVHEVQWNASQYAAGVYFYLLLTDNIKETRKMILIK